MSCWMCYARRPARRFDVGATGGLASNRPTYMPDAEVVAESACGQYNNHKAQKSAQSQTHQAPRKTLSQCGGQITHAQRHAKHLISEVRGTCNVVAHIKDALFVLWRIRSLELGSISFSPTVPLIISVTKSWPTVDSLPIHLTHRRHPNTSRAVLPGESDQR